MSNTKEVCIVAEVPFDWVQDIPDADAVFMARLFLGPAMGLKMDRRQVTSRKNRFGGTTAMYQLTITGTEAFNIERLVGVLNKAGTVVAAAYNDMDDNRTLYKWGRGDFHEVETVLDHV